MVEITRKKSMKMKEEEKRVFVQVTPETRSMIKTLASFEKQTVPEYLAFVIGKAYEAAEFNRGRKKRD